MNTEPLLSLWEDNTVDLHNTQIRKTIPQLPAISVRFQVVTGGQEVLAYLAIQIMKTQEKSVVLRCLASAAASVFKDNANYTGSASAPEALVGLEYLADEDDPTKALDVPETNFEDAVSATRGEIDNLMDAEVEELGAYFGVLFLAGVKKATPQNRAAFNERRANAVKAFCTGDLKIFTPGSPFLSEAVLNKVYATFTSLAAPRAHLVTRVATNMGQVSMGASAAFATMFMLLVDNGLGALRIIKEATLKYPWIRTEFPELKPELAVANKAQHLLRSADASARPFIKAIWGSAFVPMAYNEVDNLFGICKMVMQETTRTYANFGGGSFSPKQEQIVRSHLHTAAPGNPDTPEISD